MQEIQWVGIVGHVGSNQYQDRISFLNNKSFYTNSIERTVETTLKNLESCRSFVIFGEPQSGKTEMMIALNARLLDEGHPIIVNLLTDSVDLLDQSLRRFRLAGLSPSPKNFDQIPSNPSDLRNRKWVVFCKKNARNLEQLLETLRLEKNLLVVDDEADFASPDGNVNKDEYNKTKINDLISKLLGEDGTYIGVTATPARLNLNNTFDNQSEQWVHFEPHPDYVGQDFFFPDTQHCDYKRKLFKADEGDEKKNLTEAILHFLCGVAEQHHLGKRENFTMLVHTSGKKDVHAEDLEIVHKTINTLSSPHKMGFERLRRKLWQVAEEYAISEDFQSDQIGEFVLRNIWQNTIVEINSRNHKPGKVAEIAEPTTPFSFGVGGNIISRGVTFNNLLSLYFTRSVKGKFTQDTYIQRARMFGTRESYKRYFQLWVPETLMQNWSACFAFHKLAVQALRDGVGTPVWIADHKTIPTSPRSIDRSSVDFENGEMSFGMMDYDDNSMRELFARKEGCADKEMLGRLRSIMTTNVFPDYIYNYLLRQCKSTTEQISFHRPSEFGARAQSYSDQEIREIRRAKGIFGTNEYSRSERENARHHLKLFYNKHGQARLFYKIRGGSIKFMQNRK